MKKLFLIGALLAALGGPVLLADTKISQLPLGTATATTNVDVFPFVNLSTDTTEKMTLWDLINLPPIASPNFSGSGTMVGTLSVGTATPALSSSLLDMESTTQGFLPPRLTTTQKNAIASPRQGLVVFDSTLQTLSVYNGTAWVGAGGSAGISYAPDTGTANAYAIAPTPAALGYVAGSAYSFLAANANTGASTLNVSGLGTKAITEPGQGALTAGDILANQLVSVVYDGTQFQLISPQGPAVSADTVGAIIKRDGSGNFSAGTMTGTSTGNTTYTANNHGVVVSGTGNAMTVIAPNASTAFPFVSGGASANPAWSLLTVPGGGSGASTFTAHGILLGEGSSAFDVSGAGTSGQAFLSGGASADGAYGTLGVGAGGTGLTSGISGGIPYFSSTSAMTSSALLADFGVLIGGGAGAAPTSIAPVSGVGFPLVSGGVSASPTWSLLTVAAGGTGQNTLANHGVLVGAATSGISVTGTGTTGQALLSGGSSADPAYGTLGVATGGTGATSVTTAPSASSWAGWDANKNLSANNAVHGYATQATASGTLALTVSSAEQQYFTGSTSGQVVTLPVVATGPLPLGFSFILVNLSNQTVTVESSGGNSIQAMGGNTQLVVTSILQTGTTAASWSAQYSSANPATVTSVGVTVGAGGMTVSGSPVTSSGSITLTPKVPTVSVLAYNSGGSTFTGNRTSGSPTLASVSSFTGLYVGLAISGTGIPGSTYIQAINTGASTITMSANASSGSATSTTVTPSSTAGTYTPPAGVLYLEIEMTGGGAGGSGSGASATGGTNGASTTFGSSFLTAGLGNASATSVSNGGVGGSVTVNSGSVLLFSTVGANGQGSTGLASGIGGAGGGTPFGGVGAGGSTIPGTAANNGQPATGYGSGGGGGGTQATATTAGGGGGAAGYIKTLITTSIAATYSFTIGAGGGGGSAGTNGATGAAGGNGVVIIREVYQ